VQRADDLPRVLREAFHLASTGRPGPVLVDVPKDVAQAQMTFHWPERVDLPGYKPTRDGHPLQIEKAGRGRFRLTVAAPLSIVEMPGPR